MAVQIVDALTGQQSGSTALTISLATVEEGEWMVAALIAGDASTSVTLPAEWTVLSGPHTIGSRRTWEMGKIKEAGDTSLIVTKGGTLVMRAILVHGTGADAPADWQVGTYGRRADAVGSSTTSVAPSLTTGEADTLALAICYEATSAEDGTVQALSGTGWSLVAKLDDVASPDTTFIEQILVAQKAMAAAGATGNATVTYQNTQASNGGGVQLALTPAPAEPAGDQVTLGDGSAARARIWDGAQELGAEILGLPAPARSYTVSQMDADFTAGTTVYWAHRGGSADWPEMTMRAYTNAIFWGCPVIEVSCYVTSDDVFVGMHDATLDRVTALTGNVSAKTWAELEGVGVDVPIGGGTITRLVDILEAYGPSHVIVIEDKTYTRTSALLAMIDDVLGEAAPEHIVIKSQGAGNTAVPTSAHAAGLKTWGYFYAEDIGSGELAGKEANYDYLGLNYDASAGDWTTILGYGQPVLAHVVPDAAAAVAVLAKGAQGLQLADVTGVIPQKGGI